MTKVEMLNIIYAYLARFMECDINDITKSQTTISLHSSEKSFLKIAICGNATIISVSPNLYNKVTTLLKGKNKDELFECPLVYGQTIHYIPDLPYSAEPALPKGYIYSLFQGADIYKLSHIKGFDNSLVFDDNGHTNSAIAFVAYKGDTVIAVAGASIAYNNLWEIGIDVLPSYRGHGLATAMVRKLTCELLYKGAVPFYSASITNIGSQMVATRAGYLPCWVDSWGNIYDNYYPYNFKNILK